MGHFRSCPKIRHLDGSSTDRSGADWLGKERWFVALDQGFQTAEMIFAKRPRTADRRSRNHELYAAPAEKLADAP